ncbi:MAG: RNA-binding S4 domain-containing protein [Eubacteriales bacterium]
MKVKISRKFEGNTVEIHTETIKLQDFMKFADIFPSGGVAKMVIQDGAVTVNGEIELQRGKKLHNGDIIGYEGNFWKVKTNAS